MTDVRAALRPKYAQLIALREAALRGEGGPPQALRDLAAIFPGALRELDRAPMSELRARLRLLSGAGPLPAWAAPTLEFHALLRLALSVRVLAGPEKDRQAAVQAIVGRGEAPELVDDVLWPPSGSLTRWALSEVGRRHRLGPGQVEALVFGHLQGRGG